MYSFPAFLLTHTGELKLESGSPYLTVEMLETTCGSVSAFFWRGDFAGDVCLVVCVLSSLFDVLLVVSRANVCEVDCAVRTGRFTRCTVLVKQEVTQFWETLRNHSSMCGFSFSVYLFFFYSHESVCMLCASIFSPEFVTSLWWLFRVVPFWCGVFFDITLL